MSTMYAWDQATKIFAYMQQTRNLDSLRVLLDTGIRENRYKIAIVSFLIKLASDTQEMEIFKTARDQAVRLNEENAFYKT